MADGMSRLLKEVLVYRYDGGIEDVARHLGVTYDFVWSQTHARVNPSLDVIKAAFIVTGDPRLKQKLEPEGYELVRGRAADALKDPEAESTDVVLQASRLIENLRDALEDGIISEEEADGLEKEFCELEKEMIEARAAIRNAVKSCRIRSIK